MALQGYSRQIFAHQILATDTAETLNAVVDAVPHAPIPIPLFAPATDGSNAAVGLFDGLYYYNAVAVGDYIVATDPAEVPSVWPAAVFEGWHVATTVAP